jgi:hypothetical protein
MSDRGSSITITSGSAHPLGPLVEAAIQREVDLLSAGIRRTEQHVRAFERQHDMSSAEFLR